MVSSASKSETVGDLVKAKAITDDEVSAATEALLAKPETGTYPVGGGYLLDLAAAVKAHAPSAAALSDPDAKPGWRRTMARTALLLARPVQA